MFKDVSKTLSSNKNNTMLVLLFCGVILFMCMQKGKVMEYFSLLEENSNECGPNKKMMHIYEPKYINEEDKHIPICIEQESEFDRLGLVLSESMDGTEGGVTEMDMVDRDGGDDMGTSMSVDDLTDRGDGAGAGGGGAGAPGSAGDPGSAAGGAGGGSGAAGAGAAGGAGGAGGGGAAGAGGE